MHQCNIRILAKVRYDKTVLIPKLGHESNEEGIDFPICSNYDLFETKFLKIADSQLI